LVIWYDPNLEFSSSKEALVKKFQIFEIEEWNMYFNFEKLLKRISNIGDLDYCLIMAGEIESDVILNRFVDFSNLKSLYIYDTSFEVDKIKHEKVITAKTIEDLVPKIEGIQGDLIRRSNLPESEIIIKCSIKGMVKAFFKDFVIIWHDPHMSSEENQQYITPLKKFCEVFTFTEWEKASIFIHEAKTACQVITSGTNGELLAEEISLGESVKDIYLFCENKEYHEAWAKNYQKVSCVEIHIENILSKIQRNLLEWYKQASSLKLNLPAFAPIFNDNDKSQINHLHRFLKVIPNFENRLQAKNDFTNLSKGIYSDVKNLKVVADFEQSYNDYNKKQILE